MTGKIKSFSRSHGYGFVEAGREDVFFHIIDWNEKDDPVIGEDVDFMWLESEKGLRAIRIRRLRHGK